MNTALFACGYSCVFKYNDRQFPGTDTPMTRITRRRSRRDEEESETGRRDVRKQRTRRALLDAALELMQGEQSFNSISLREVARNAGVVPTAFYRHFRDMDELGLTLVEEALRALRQMMREARSAPLPASSLISRSVQTYIGVWPFVRAPPCLSANWPPPSPASPVPTI